MNGPGLRGRLHFGGLIALLADSPWVGVGAFYLRHFRTVRVCRLTLAY